MAQIMAYHEWPKNFQSNLTASFKDPYTKAKRYPKNIAYNWPAMKTHQNANNLATDEAKTQVGALLLDVGKAVNVNYSTFEAPAENVPAAFKSLKYNVPSGLTSYDFNAVKASIDNKRPVFIGGYDSYKTYVTYKYFLWFRWDYRTYNIYSGGHAWVIDDYRIKQEYIDLLLVYSDGTTQELPFGFVYQSENQVHCNIGLGASYSTGWYASGAFNTRDGATRPERASDAKNYAYKLEIVPNIYPKK
jgi:hypothetical protein